MVHASDHPSIYRQYGRMIPSSIRPQRGPFKPAPHAAALLPALARARQRYTHGVNARGSVAHAASARTASTHAAALRTRGQCAHGLNAHATGMHGVNTRGANAHTVPARTRFQRTRHRHTRCQRTWQRCAHGTGACDVNVPGTGAHTVSTHTAPAYMMPTHKQASPARNSLAQGPSRTSPVCAQEASTPHPRSLSKGWRM